MKDEEKFLEELFDRLLKDYLLLEKSLYESYTRYRNNPSEDMKLLLSNVCSYGRLQIMTLLELLPKVCSGELLRNYEQKLEIKKEELFNIRADIDREYQK